MARGNARDFGKRMGKRAEQVIDGANKAKRLAAMQLVVDLTYGTPVDTGRARSNWLVDLGTPPTETVEARGANSTIGAARAKVQDSKPSQTVYIANNVEYIGALNDGHSAQAAAGFVERAVQRVFGFFAKAKIFTG